MDNKDREQLLLVERMKQLSNYGRTTAQNIQESSIDGSTLIDYKKAGDGIIYGIVKENQSFFIKKATPSSDRKPNVTDFVYIGGLENKNSQKYDNVTLAEAQKILGSKIAVINESFGHVYENEEEELPLPEPIPVPDGSEGGEGEAGPEAQAEPSPEGAPAPEGEGDASLEGGGESEGDPINKAKSHIGKAGNYIRQAQTTPEMTKQIANMFLGYLDFQTMSQEDKQALVDTINNKNVEEDIEMLGEDDEFELELKEEAMPDAQTITAILGGVATVFGLAGGIDALMKYVKSKNPKLAKSIEQLGSSAGSGIRGGSTSLEEEAMPDAQTVAAILGGVAGVFGLAGGIDGLMAYVKRKNPKLAKNIENLASSAGSGIRGGSTSLEEEAMPDMQTIGAILGGVAGVFGLAGGISGLMSYVKKKNPALAKSIEQLGSSAGSGIKGGDSKFRNESVEIGLEEEDEDDDMDLDLGSDDMGSEMDLGSEELESTGMGAIAPAHDSMVASATGASNISIDAKTGKVDITLSEKMIKNLSKKTGISEQKLINKIYEMVEQKKVEKEKLIKEERLRLTINNIIKEKLGLKKKVLKEGKESPTRLKLEKLVESYLVKKNVIKDTKKK